MVAGSWGSVVVTVVVFCGSVTVVVVVFWGSVSVTVVVIVVVELMTLIIVVVLELTIVVTVIVVPLITVTVEVVPHWTCLLCRQTPIVAVVAVEKVNVRAATISAMTRADDRTPGRLRLSAIARIVILTTNMKLGLDT